MNLEITLLDIDFDNRYLAIFGIHINYNTRHLLYIEWKPYYKHVELGFIQVIRKYYDQTPQQVQQAAEKKRAEESM